jgi:cytochrome c oxidase subunit IV
VNATTGRSEGPAGMSWFLKVWAMLLVLTGVEIFLAYEELPVHIMLILLMGLSLIKAAMIVAYFMHLRYERTSLVWTLVPATIFVFVMMTVFFSDSLRIVRLGLFLH